MYSRTVARPPLSLKSIVPGGRIGFNALTHGNGVRLDLAYDLAFAYSDSGNTLADTRDGRDLAFAYDASDRLAAVSDGGVEIARYGHNALGQRVVKQAGLERTHYVYDAGGRLIAEVDARTAKVLVEYAWLGGVPLAAVFGGGLATYHAHADHLGTPQVLTDAGGRIVWSAVYRPFGETASAGGRLAGGAAFNLRFPGQYYDAETGLHYNYFRDYDPSTGRYIQSDPIGLQGGFNVYAYVGGNPLRYTDPTGEIAVADDVLIIGAIGLTIGAVWLMSDDGQEAIRTTVVAISNAAESAAEQCKQAWDQAVQRQAEYRAYKNRCNESPPPGLSICEKAKWKMQRNLDCALMREAWDNKWNPGRHASDVDAYLNAAAKIEKWIVRNCR